VAKKVFNMKKALLLLLVVTFQLSAFSFELACAQGPDELFLQANKQYEAGSYSSAINSYEDLLSKGLRSAQLFYNLGNAYFKAGKPGPAILNYERARVLDPRDEDMKFNLEFARESTLQAEQKQKNPVMETLKGVYDLLSVGELTVIFSICYFLLIAFICVWFFRKSAIFNLAIRILLIAAAISGIWWGIKLYNVNQPSAIVVKSDCGVRSGPGMEYSAGFIVPEGKKVLVLRENRGWCEVGLKEEGLKGWTESDKVERIKP